MPKTYKTKQGKSGKDANTAEALKYQSAPIQGCE